MRKLIVAGLAGTLLAPALGSISTAEAQTVSRGVSNCVSHKYGTTFRIKLTYVGGPSRLLKVRVSHPRGTGKFYNPKIKRTTTTTAGLYPPAHAARFGITGMGPSSKPKIVETKFKLKDGRSFTNACVVSWS